MSKLDAFLFEKADVYDRLRIAFDAATERFWRQLGKTLHALVKEVVGDGCSDTFSSAGYWVDEAGYAYFNEWRFDFGERGGEPKDWERYPSFWFPQSMDESQKDTLAVVGAHDSEDIAAVIWATPISRYVNDLGWARSEWEKGVNSILRPMGWAPYGERVITPTGDWGTRLPIRLNHLEIAKCMEQGDLRPALGPLEKSIKDFASVRDSIDAIVSQARSKRNRHRKRP